MIESRDIQREDFRVSHKLGNINIRITTVRLWDDKTEPECSRFNIQMKLSNEEVSKMLNEGCLEGGNWTVIAHSDHNGNDEGHDIRDKNDCKNLHLDIHPKVTNKGYNITHKRICGGNPPNTNDDAINYMIRYMKENCEQILNIYLNFYEVYNF